MAQFKNVGFTFDGINAEDLGYYIVSTDSELSAIIGTNRTIQEEESNNFAPSYQGVKYNVMTFDITIAKVRDGNLVPITEDDIYYLNNWLLKPEEYKIFISHQNRDILYYVMFTEASNYMNSARQGYINLTMRFASGCSYSTIAHHQYVVSGTKTFEVFNKSNVEQYVHPDVFFKTTLQGNFSVRNDTLGIEMAFTDVPSNTSVRCYNEGLKQIVCESDPGLNLRPKFNKTWIRLAYGRNVITVKGNCTVDLHFQNKIAIQN